MQRSLRLYPTTILLTSLVLSIIAPPCGDLCQKRIAKAGNACAHVQEFLATAYYSPLPDQEKYALGSFEEDIRFNGHGIRGNDGTEEIGIAHV